MASTRIGCSIQQFKSISLSTFYIVGFCPLFKLWDFVLWDSVRRDFVLWDFVLWDSVLWDFVLWDFVLWDSVRIPLQRVLTAYQLSCMYESMYVSSCRNQLASENQLPERLLFAVASGVPCLTNGLYGQTF